VAEIRGEEVRAKDAAEVWSIKIKRVKKVLKGWGMSLKGHTSTKMFYKKSCAVLKKMKRMGVFLLPYWKDKRFIQTELLRLFAEELYWHKRSNLNWLLEGDNNTGFFHRIAKGKKRKNTIFSLEDSDSIIKEHNQLLEHATWYYKTLFGPSIDPIMEMDSDCWEDNEKISDADNAKLTSPFSEEEVKRTIFDMEKNTALGHGSARR